MVFNTTFNNISVISWQPEYQEKTTDLPQVQVTDKFDHIMLHFAMNGLQAHNLSGDRQLIAQAVVNPTTIQSQPWRPTHLLAIRGKYIGAFVFQ
jgi:hypothetical protein